MKRLRFLALLSLFLLLQFSYTDCFPEAAVRQKKIDRERKQKEKQARKAYELDLKKHHQNQSKETRAMMKQSRKKSKKFTPLKTK